MKKAILLSFVLCLINSKLFAQSQKKLEIIGEINGLHEGEKVFLVRGEHGQLTPTIMDSCLVSNGKFSLHGGHISDGPRQFTVTFSEHEFRLIDYFDNENVRIHSLDDINHLPGTNILEYVIVDGSPTHVEHMYFAGLQRLWSNHRANMDQILKKPSPGIFTKNNNQTPGVESFDYYEGMLYARNSIDGLGYRYLLQDPIKKLTPKFIVNLAAYNNFFHDSLLLLLYSKFDEKTKNSYYGKLMKELLPLCVGQVFPEFALPDSSGTIVSIKNIYSKSKLTLVNFWATNSTQGLEFKRELEAVYNKYNKKGLSIVGVSSDFYASKWKAEIRDRPWINVSDLKGEEGVTNKIYREFGNSQSPNTTNVLIDSNGKILAWDVSGNELKWWLIKVLNE